MKFIIQLWLFIRQEISTLAFEKWIYETPEIETFLGSELYLKLISLNFGDQEKVNAFKVEIWDWLSTHYPDFIETTYGRLTTPWEPVRFFAAKCRSCNTEFDLPLLSDFSYGESIFQSELGNYFNYCCAIDNKVWDIVSGLIHEFYWDGDYWFIFAACADRVHSQNMGLLPRCPHCQSHSVDYSNKTPTRDGHIHVASFRTFMNLAPAEQLSFIKKTCALTRLSD